MEEKILYQVKQTQKSGQINGDVALDWTDGCRVCICCKHWECFSVILITRQKPAGLNLY